MQVKFGKRGSEDGIGSAAHFIAPAGIWSDGVNIYVSNISTILFEAPFNTATAGRSRTFTLSASAPVGVIALRGFINERSEFLMTTLPVTDLSASRTRVTFPQFATGGGWTTDLALVNSSDSLAEGELEVLHDDGSIDSTNPYTIAPRSAFSLRLPNTNHPTETGQIRVTPKTGQPHAQLITAR